MAQQHRRRHPLKILCIAALLLALAVGFFQLEQRWIQSDTLEASFERLPAELDGLRVVVISDLHGKEFGNGNSALLKKVAEQSPDLIAITGDVVDRKSQVDILPTLGRGLTKIAPTYYVTGNHEWAAKCVPEVRKTLGETGVFCLSNGYERFTKNGATIAVAGVDDPNGPYGQKTPAEVLERVREEDADVFVLMLAHRNDEVAAYEAARADLVLCGHGHGGMIRLPFVGGLLGNDRELFPENTQGLCPLQGTTMAVSRGLGNTTVPVKSFRLFNRPELLTVILRANGQGE